MIREKELLPKTETEFRIAHLSDLHISADRSGLRHRWRSWVGKSQAKNLLNLQAVLRDIASREVDHFVITGDLTNGAKQEEFETLKAALGDYLDPSRLTIIPGNHDLSYRRVSRRLRTKNCPRKHWQLISHFPNLFPLLYPPELKQAKKNLFPFVKVLAAGRIVLIVLDTTGHLTAKIGLLNSLGTVNRVQLAELRTLLRHPWLHDKIKIVVMHHHPMIVPVATMFDSFKYMFQSKQLLDLLYESRVDLILHGHKHHPFCWQSHTFRDHDLTVICAGPPDAYASARSSDLVYNIYSIVGHRVAIHYRTCSPTLRPRTEFAHAPKRLSE
jgi:3',5'-cyclic AMP phosphodiesterase CpdA